MSASSDGGRDTRTNPGGSLEAVRSELRSLGYLRDPLGVLIVPRSKGRATFLRVILLTSLRCGLLGGLLLAPPAAFAFARLSRPHMESLRDIVLLGLYLLPVLAAGVGLLNLLGDLLVRLIAARGGTPGRGGRLAARIGAALAAALSLYFALVWGRSGEGSTSVRGALTGLVIIVPAGLIVGWLVRSGALVAIATLGGRIESAHGPGRHMLWSLAALTGAAGVLLAVDLETPREPRPMPPLAASASPARLIVIGIDGIEKRRLESMSAALEAPALRKIMNEGASWRLRAYPSNVPPEVWTSIATGMPGEAHGVRAFEVHRLPGLRSPLMTGAGETAARVTILPALRLLAFFGRESGGATPLSSTLRRSRAVWEIEQAAGRPAGVVNWWGTWPASAEGAVTVSDRALGFLAARMGQGGDKAIEVEGGETSSVAHPLALLRELSAEFSGHRSAITARFDAAARREAAPAPGRSGEVVRSAHLIDAWHLEVALGLFADRPIRSLYLYLPGLDIAAAELVGGVTGSGPTPAGGAGLDGALWAAAGQKILVREIERGVGLLLEHLGPEDLLVLICDPGRLRSLGEGEEGQAGVWVFGHRVSAGGERGPAEEIDLAPTLLAISGLPHSLEQAGTLLPGLSDAVEGLGQIGTVASFGDRPTVAIPEGGDEAEVLDRLRSLGYIQ